jgi:hypothetical protein
MEYEDELRTCIDFIGRRSWDWFVTLRYPHTIKPRPNVFDYGRNPRDSFTSWIDEVTHNGAAYVRAVEERKNGDLWFHVLISDCSQNSPDWWRYRWYQLSAGSAWDRILNDGIERLFAYLAYRRGCFLETSYGGFRTVASRSDYWPW